MKHARHLLAVWLLAAASGASAQDYKFEFHGFVTGSMFIQDQSFATGNGQGLLFSAPSPSAVTPTATTPPVGTADTLLGADLRQSRFIFSLSGPETLGATPRAYLETDLGTGYQDWNPRVRATYAELNWGATQFLAGQYSAQLIFAMLPVSVGHIANPVTFGIGNLGTRGMGFRALHKLTVGGVRLELAGEVLSAKWNETSNGTTAATVPVGWATGFPFVGARVKAEGKVGPVSYVLHVAGLYQSVDLTGFGHTVSTNGVTLADGTQAKRIESWAGEAGGRFDLGPAALLFSGYTGEALAPFAGGLRQFGNITDVGWWVQPGVNVTDELSLWAMYGQANLPQKQVLNWRNYPTNPGATGYSSAKNEIFGGVAKFQRRGYAIALEYTRYNTTYLTDPAGAPATYATYVAGTTTNKVTDASQYMLTAGYFF